MTLPNRVVPPQKRCLSLILPVAFLRGVCVLLLLLFFFFWQVRRGAERLGPVGGGEGRLLPQRQRPLTNPAEQLQPTAFLQTHCQRLHVGLLSEALTWGHFYR